MLIILHNVYKTDYHMII